MLLDRDRRIRIWRYCVDPVELRNQIGKRVVVVDGEQPMEARAQDIQVALSQQAYGNNTIFGQRSSPGLGRRNGRRVDKCHAMRRFVGLSSFQEDGDLCANGARVEAAKRKVPSSATYRPRSDDVPHNIEG